MTFEIIPERPAESPLLDPLLDRTFGFDRHQRTVYRLRAQVAPVAALCFAAVAADGGMLGSLRFWPVAIGEARVRAVLLGPLAVEPALQGMGIGRALVAHGLAEARWTGERICLVVGAPAYYRPFGFANAGMAGLTLPGPVEPERFQVAELMPGALDGIAGLVQAASAEDAA